MGNLLESAQPSAVAGYSETGSGTGLSVTLNASSGRIDVYTYYATTTATTSTPGGVAGWAYQTAVAQGANQAAIAIGQSGGPVLKTSTDYIAATAGTSAEYFTHSSTQYQNADGSGVETSTYSYTFNGLAIASQTTTLPVVSTAQHGSGAATQSTEIYDSFGRVVWSQDAAGSVSYTRYDPATGAVLQQIQDANVNANNSGQYPSADWALLPAGWQTTGAAAKNLTTAGLVDSQGRTIEQIDADGNVTWTVYNDPAHETRTYPGWHQDTSGNWQTTGPVQVSRDDAAHSYSESLAYVWSGSLPTTSVGAVTAPSGQEDYSTGSALIQSLSRSLLNQAGQVTSSIAYSSMPGAGYSESTPAFGTEGVNYLETDYYYDSVGRQDSTHSPDGTVDDTFYDGFGRVTAEWKGTSDSGDASFHTWVAAHPTATVDTSGGISMYKISASVYDTDGNLLESDAYFDPSGVAAPRKTYYQYDWQDREFGTLGPDSVAQIATLDNLGETTQGQTYANATMGSGGQAGQILYTSGNLRGQSQSDYDSLGRVYESRTFNVSPTSGAVGDYLPTDTWYDPRGNVAKTESGNGPFTKYAYDSADRLTTSYTSYDATEYALSDSTAKYSAALDVSGDTVIEQQQTWYDADGNSIASADYQRLPSDSTSTGALTGANSYVTAAVSFYDLAGYNVENVSYGREDTGLASGQTHYFFNGTTGALIDANADGIPDAAQSTPPAPNSSDNYLVGQTAYKYVSAGPIVDQIDNSGAIAETQSDLLGRTTRTIQNFDGLAYGATGSGFDSSGNVLATSTARDLTTDDQYDSSGRLVTQATYDAKGSGTSVQAQATKYLYTSPIDGSLVTAQVAPDSTDTLSQNGTTRDWTISSGTDHTSATFDLQGATLTSTDQRGVIHSYTYDLAGRLYTDAITNFGNLPAAAQTVVEIVTDYDDLGRVLFVTSCANNYQGNPYVIVNQVKNSYDGWGNLAQQWQSHSGLVVDSGSSATPSVQYVYADGASGGVAQYVRLDHILYPNGRQIDYNYVSGVDSIMSRITSIQTDGEGTANAAYTYLGAETIASEDYQQPQVKLDYSADNFAALDRFGQVLDQVWATYGGSTKDGYSYTYDRAGNRTARNNATDAALNDAYTYDALNRLTQWSEGSPLVQQKTWTLDSLGNDLGSGSYSAGNEETPNSGSSGYDLAGNMTTLTSGDAAIYDAWNRLVEVDSGSTILEKCQYDGANRRIQVATNFSGSTPGTVTDDYLSGQQVVESDITTNGVRNGGYQYVWSLRYIDAPIARDTLNTAGTAIVAASRVFYLADANYNVTALVGTAGQVLERYSYTPYGVVTFRNADWSTAGSSANANTILYTGRVLDTATGLFYYRARYYDAGLERFVSKDPIGFAAGDESLYRYVGNSPAQATDPTGMIWTWETRSKPRAEVCNDPGDTVRELALTIRLNADEYRGWLESADGGDLPASEDARIGRRRKFTVPNVVVEYQGQVGFLDVGPAVNACKVAAMTTAAQYGVYGFDHVSVTDGTLQSFRREFQSKDTYGFIFGGHGGAIKNKNGEVLDNVLYAKDVVLTLFFSQTYVTIDNVQRPAHPFKLAFLRLYACNSADPNSQGEYWSQYVSKKGTFEGGRGLVYVWSKWATWTGPTPP